MKELIKYVLENYPEANLASDAARDMIATAILNYCDKEGIVMYTSLDKRDLNAAEEAKYHGANS